MAMRPGFSLQHSPWGLFSVLLAALAFCAHNASGVSEHRPVQVRGALELYKIQVQRLPTLDKFVSVIPVTPSRLPLVAASRSWRSGMRTLVIINDSSLLPELNARGRDFNEFYEYWPDDDMTSNHHGWYPGDTRAAVAPFLAHRAFGNTYHWMLYGDDDTIFLLHGVMRMLQGYDPIMPAAITDTLWYPDASAPSRLAPRCLPCHYPLATLTERRNLAFPGAQPGCPCTPQLACGTQRSDLVDPLYPSLGFRYMTEADYEAGIANLTFPGPDRLPGATPPMDCAQFSGRRLSNHGGAGVVLSVGLLRSVPVEAWLGSVMEQNVSTGGDFYFAQALFRHGFAFTDPGPSLINGDRLRWNIFDNRYLEGECLTPWVLDRFRVESRQGRDFAKIRDAHCQWVVMNAVTVHLSSRRYLTFDDAAKAMLEVVANYRGAVQGLRRRYR